VIIFSGERSCREFFKAGPMIFFLLRGEWMKLSCFFVFFYMTIEKINNLIVIIISNFITSLHLALENFDENIPLILNDGSGDSPHRNGIILWSHGAPPESCRPAS